MDLFNIVSGIASIVALVFAAYVHHRAKLSATTEGGNIRVVTERMQNASISLRSSASILHLLIRRADDESASVVELQNLARAARTNILATLVEVSGTEDALKSWKFGESLESFATNEEGAEPGRPIEER